MTPFGRLSQVRRDACKCLARMEKATGESSLVPPEESAEDEDDHDDEDDWADAKQIRTPYLLVGKPSRLAVPGIKSLGRAK